jgi:two-component system capsular synthesis response regulator RcsB
MDRNVMNLQIVLADDHPIVSSGVRQLLEQDGSWKVVGVAATPEELLDILQQTSCDLLITDFSMPGKQAADGLGLLRAVRRTYPDLPVIVLTMITNPAVLQSVMETGVRSLINKSDTLVELPMAVRAVVKGRNYVSKTMTTVLQDAPIQRLSPREVEVLRLFASGHSVSDIAKQLNRSIKTISTQKTEAMAKLGIKNDLGIYAYAREHGLI